MKTTVLSCLFSVAGVLAVAEPEAPTVTEQNVFTFYQSFKRLTKEPHYVAPLTAILCTSPSPELVEREKASTGPHYHARVHIYCDPIAADAIARGSGAFSAGAVIVKEKLADDGSVTAVGGMVKRVSGFEVEHGDWEYFYAARTGGFSTGRLQNCIECHARARETDYVFSVWKQFR